MSKNRYGSNDDQTEQGFEQASALNDEHYIVANNLDETQPAFQNNLNKQLIKKHRANFLIKEKPKLKLDALEIFPLTSRKKGDSQKYIKSLSLQKTIFEQSSNHQILTTQQKLATKQGDQRGRGQSIEEMISTAIIKTKRSQVGEDLIIKIDQNLEIQKGKEIDQNAAVVFKKRAHRSTYELFKELAKYSTSSFLKSKYNAILRSKIEKSQPKYEETPPKFEGEDLKFQANIESSNLNLVTKVSPEEYNLFLSVDTNTRGHQSWFYFVVTNNKATKLTIQINICNMKRKFPMIKNGQGIYKKSKDGGWEFIPQVQIEHTEKNKYRLSFILRLDELEKAEVSLIPPYTYSDMLREVQSYETSPNAKVQILTHSLAGLAVPMVTITKGARTINSQKNRNLYLITARIHPSETCSSFIVSALIRQLLQNRQYQEFLRDNVVKIVPMVNPDGVVFGNFRTNYLGVDLNRSFQYNDESIYPETVALKELGRKCKEEFNSNFLCFLDLHGHSSQASSFIYGPEYVQGCQNYIECRILPKILDRVSSYFRYDYSSFRLQEYKFNTARGYFFKKLKIPAYTIQTSYALYCPKTSDEQRSYVRLGVAQWQEFGRSIASSLKINSQCLSLNQQQKQTSKQEASEKEQKKKRIQSINKIQQNPISVKFVQAKTAYVKLRKEILYEIKNEKPNFKTVASKKEESDSESDGENNEQDLVPQERDLIIKKLNETARGKSIFPKVLKESKQTTNIPPQLIPTFYIGNNNDLGILQRISSKFRNKRYNRPVNISQEYTEYLLRNITGISSLRPQVINFNPKIYKPSNMKLSSESP